MEEKHPKEATEDPKTVVAIVANSKWKNTAPKEILDLFKKFRTSNELVSEVLARMKTKKESADEAAMWFLKNHQQTWKTWITKDANKSLKKYVASSK